MNIGEGPVNTGEMPVNVGEMQTAAKWSGDGAGGTRWYVQTSGRAPLY